MAAIGSEAARLNREFRPVAQFGRAAVSKTAGWGFDSLLACHLNEWHGNNSVVKQIRF
jgi:hypothetical protein